VSVRFDDPNLVSCGGLVAVLALVARCGLAELVTERVRIAAKGGANAAAKIVALIAGMVAGAEGINDMDLLRHGGMSRLFAEARAPSTLGTFLRLFIFGHVRQLDAVAAGFLARLAAVTPVLSGVGQVAFLDVDDTVRATYGYAKQGAGRGYTGVNGLNALLATVSTPLSAPVIAATRLRRGAVNSVRGAARLLADALVCARCVGAIGLVIVRADSAFYSYDIVAAARRAGARFSHRPPHPGGDPGHHQHRGASVDGTHSCTEGRRRPACSVRALHPPCSSDPPATIGVHRLPVPSGGDRARSALVPPLRTLVSRC
jgi:hypothetical protein